MTVAGGCFACCPVTKTQLDGAFSNTAVQHNSIKGTCEPQGLYSRSCYPGPDERYLEHFRHTSAEQVVHAPVP